MKFSLALSLLFVCFTIQAQDTFLFQPHYKASSTYKTTMNISISAENYQGPDAMSSMTAAMNNDMLMEMSMKTGVKNDSGKLPFELFYTKMEMKSMMLPNGLPDIGDQLTDVVIHGHVGDGIKIEVDSVSGGGDDPMMKAAFNQGVQQMSSNAVSFPTKHIAIGESFENDMSSSLSAQMPGAKAIVKYTLQSVDGDNATFQTTMSMSGGMGDMMKMTGEGSGTMTFDLSEQFVTNLDLPMTMTMTMTQGDEKISFDMIMGTTMIVEVVK